MIFYLIFAYLMATLVSFIYVQRKEKPSNNGTWLYAFVFVTLAPVSVPLSAVLYVLWKIAKLVNKLVAKKE
jgi:hypothetical protein